MKKRDKDASELDRLFFGSLALCTAIGVGAIIWHLRLPNITTDYLQSESFKKDFADRVKQLAGLEVTFGKIEGGTGLGFAMSDVKVRSADGQQLNCRIDRVQGELGRDLKFADVRRLRLTRPSCEMAVDSSLNPIWRPEVAKVSASDLKLLLGARLRGVSFEDADLKLTQNGKDAAHFTHFDVEAEGDVDVQGFNATAEIKGNKATRLGTTLAQGGVEIGFEGGVKANLPRTGELHLTADAQITEPAGTHFVGPSMLPLTLGLDASAKTDGKVAITRLQVQNPQLKTVFKGMALNSPDGKSVAMKLSTSSVSLALDAQNEVVVHDANLAVDAAFKGNTFEVGALFNADNVKMPNDAIFIRALTVDTFATLQGGGRLELKKMKVTSGGDQTLVSLTGIVDARAMPPTVDVTGDFRQQLGVFDFKPGNAAGTVDGSIKLKTNAQGALVAEGMATVDIPEARDPNVVITGAKAEVPFRFEVTRPERLAEWMDIANPDQLLDKYFATAKSFDLTARGTVASVKITPRRGSKDQDVTLSNLTLDSTYRLVPGSGRTELWGRARTDSIVAPPLDGSAIRDLKYSVDAGFAYHQENGGSVDFALDFTDKNGKMPPTKANATIKSHNREITADYRVAGPLFSLIAKTAGLDVLIKHESADVSGTVRFANMLNKVDMKSWAYLPFNFPYQGEVSGSGRFELKGISYDYLEGVRRIAVPALSGTFEHSDGGAGHRVGVIATADAASVTLDNGNSYKVNGLLTSINGSFQTPFPSASAPFRVELRGHELENGKTGAKFPEFKVAAVFDVQKAQSLRVAAVDVSLDGEKLVTGSGNVAGFYPLAGVDLWGDVKFDTHKFKGLTSLSDGLGEVRIPVRLSSAGGSSLRLVGSVLRKDGDAAAPKMVPVDIVWKVAADNHIDPAGNGNGLESVIPKTFFETPFPANIDPGYHGSINAH